MEPERACPQCGQIIPWGQVSCPFCSEHRGYFWSLRREALLLVVLVLLILLFVITSFATRFYRNVEKGYAQDWYIRGEEDLRAGREDAALVDFRTALSYSHDNERYELRLAEALVAAGHTREAGTEARTYLLNLWEREPGNGTVNLELGRLAARDHAVQDVLRFYHGAIYGAWEDDPVGKRRATRLELVQVLLDLGQKAYARGELIALTAVLPPDPALQTQVGTLLLQVASYDDALKLFRAALARQPHLPAALAGAGECYFQSDDYAEAERYLARAVQEDPSLTHAAALRDTARAVMNLDPFNRRLSTTERARRAILAFDTALTRLQNCAKQRGVTLTAQPAQAVASGDSLQNLYAQAAKLKPRVKERNLRRDSELLSSTMDVAFEIEQTTANACGAPQGPDLALLLIAREEFVALASSPSPVTGWKSVPRSGIRQSIYGR